MKIVQCDPGAANRAQHDEIIAAMTEVVDSGWFILGNNMLNEIIKAIKEF